MKKEIIKSLTDTFQEHSHTTDNGVEFWFARDIQHLLGYAEWRNFAIIRSKGDVALFGEKTTQQMKEKLDVPKDRALADFLPAITIKAKDFATEITIFNAKDKVLKTEGDISAEHIKNNKGVRKLLLERGIKPEELPAGEDIKKLERRIKSEENQIDKKKYLTN